MPKSKLTTPSILGACILPIFAVCVLVIVAGVAFIIGIPAQVRNTFGVPSPRLGESQRFNISVQLLMQKASLTKAKDPQATPKPFIIQPGESTSAISNRLQSEGFISSAGAFRNYLIYKGIDTSIQAGIYLLSGAQTPVEIALAIQDSTPGEVEFGVLAGWRIEEIAASLPKSGLNINPDDFIRAAYTPPQGYDFQENIPDTATFEGLLTPGIYELPRDITAEELIARLATQFGEQMTPSLQNGFAEQGLSLYQAVILASIIEREAIQEDEMPMIASVFLNRLAIGMKLDSDPTIQYAAGYQAEKKTWWINPLVDTSIDSPYNTYLYRGLPPTPICNPGFPAINAVANPVQTGFYYFRAACDGSGRHNFAVTYEEHKANACP